MYLCVVPKFNAILQKFKDSAEKSGWTYVDVPSDVIATFKLPNRKEFRVKGVIDDVPFDRMACYPMGEGRFIVAINATLRKKIGKQHGATVCLQLEKDSRGPAVADELMACLQTEPAALAQFSSLSQAHQNYFHNYVNSAKGADTRAGRIVNSINALLRKQSFGEMLRGLKK